MKNTIARKWIAVKKKMRSVVQTPDKDQRGTWAAHAGPRLHSNSSITDVTLERSNLERGGECQAEGDKQIDRVLVSAGHPPPTPPRGEALAWMNLRL